MSVRPSHPLRIALIGPSRTPVSEPFDGGLVAHVWGLTRALLERGHDVTLFAAPGSDADLPVSELELDPLDLSDDARTDVSMPPELMLREHHAYLRLMMQLAGNGSSTDPPFDVVHNHSLHYLPLAMSGLVRAPMMTTLHAPPTAWLESAIRCATPGAMRYLTVSEHTAGRWRPLVGPVAVLRNGVDLSRWRFGSGGPDVVWTGRIVPEKAPHLAVEAARRVGRRIVLAGPVDDRTYFKADVEPLLGDDVDYAGHLDQQALSALVRTSGVALVTPVWNEPYGLVAAEALASGTPVAGFERGGVPEVVDDSCARLVEPGNIDALADALLEAELLSRRAARARAVQHCSITAMVDDYETLLDRLVAT